MYCCASCSGMSDVGAGMESARTVSVSRPISSVSWGLETECAAHCHPPSGPFVLSRCQVVHLPLSGDRWKRNSTVGHRTPVSVPRCRRYARPFLFSFSHCLLCDNAVHCWALLLAVLWFLTSQYHTSGLSWAPRRGVPSTSLSVISANNCLVDGHAMLLCIEA